MTDSDYARHLSTAAGITPTPGQEPSAGQLLWNTLIAAGITPTLLDHNAGIAITLDLGDGTTVMISEQGDISHPAEEHQAWYALHYDDPTDPGSYVVLYLGGNLPHTVDTAACVEAVTSWLAARTASTAVPPAALDELRKLITARTDPPLPDGEPAAGHHLWDSLIAAGITPSIDTSIAGRAIRINLPDSSTIWLTGQADITHPPAAHDSWGATHFYDPDDPGPYLQIYDGPGGLGLESDTAACVTAAKAWIAAHTATGAVARQNAYVALPRTLPRDTLSAAWKIGYAHPGFNGLRPTTSTEQHTATRLDRRLHTGHEIRGACLACRWEGPSRRNRNEAVEDALDHTHPGWRSLPTMPLGSSGKNDARLCAHRDAIYPPGWWDTGGPLKVSASSAKDLHEPGRAPGGGYLIKIYRPTDGPMAEQLSIV
ncbi:DUF6349 family protein [Kitasatospora sp. NPDC004745]|uniref:DUF6349 family protein n=1 Tax=Kitasatospora sp. NPDC004745 TaxID=3364019 RepID=UPI0036B338DA